MAISMTYGLPVQRNNDPLVHLSDSVFKAVVLAASPGKYLVNIIPFLKYIPSWFPGAQFKRDARQTRMQLDQILEEPFRMTQKDMVR
jgi:hypothetical protein